MRGSDSITPPPTPCIGIVHFLRMHRDIRPFNIDRCMLHYCCMSGACVCGVRVRASLTSVVVIVVGVVVVPEYDVSFHMSSFNENTALGLLRHSPYDLVEYPYYFYFMPKHADKTRMCPQHIHTTEATVWLHCYGFVVFAFGMRMRTNWAFCSFFIYMYVTTLRISIVVFWLHIHTCPTVT